MHRASGRIISGPSRRKRRRGDLLPLSDRIITPGWRRSGSMRTRSKALRKRGILRTSRASWKRAARRRIPTRKRIGFGVCCLPITQESLRWRIISRRLRPCRSGRRYSRWRGATIRIYARRTTVRIEEWDLKSARAAYFRIFSPDYFYGIDANQHNQRNLGSVAQATLTIPVWELGRHAQQGAAQRSAAAASAAGLEPGAAAVAGESGLVLPGVGGSACAAQSDLVPLGWARDSQ